MQIEERIVELESRISFQEDTIDQLNDRVWQQQQQIDLLEHAIKRLAKYMKSIGDNGNEIIDTRPPHY